MPAPPGNEFWKQRTKHGRDKIFTEPETLWNEACKYFNWCDQNPWHRNEVIKGGKMAGEIKSVAIERPYTMQGLTLYLNISLQYFDNFERNLNPETNEQDKGFMLVLSRIRETISRQKLEGAMVGTFNPMIVSRIEGLSDKQEIRTQQDIKVNVSDDEARRIAKNIKDNI